MENNPLSKNTYAFGVALAVCSVLNAAIVIAKESSKSVAAQMQKITGHHWTTHVVLVLVVFGFLGGLLRGKVAARISPASLNRLVLGGVTAGIICILGFYLFID